MSALTVRLLGSIEIRDPAGRESEALPRQAKRLALLAYLATARPRGFHRRDKLVALFWPEASQAQARHSLSQALHVLRSELGDGAVRTRGDSGVAIDDALISCDVVAFERAVDDGAHAKALELYRGHLLDGLFVRGAPEFERWLDDERTRLREKAARAAWALAHEHIEAGRPVDAERTAQRALSLVPTDESDVRRFIPALADAGDRAAALRFYEKFAERLRSEYSIEPDPATVAISVSLAKVAEDRKPPPAVSGQPSTGGPAARVDASGGRASTRRTRGGTAVARSGKLRMGLGLAAVVIAVTPLALLLPGWGGAALDPNRVLVVAFADNTGRMEVEALGSWAQDHIIQVLTEAGFAKVVDPFTTLDTLQDAAADGKTAGDVLALAEEARAGTVVSGNIYAQGDSLYVQARITSATDGSSMATVQPVVGSTATPRELVVSLAQEVALALAPLLDHELGPLEPGPRPASYEAYQAYSEGLKAHALGEGLAVAVRHFERAVEADSMFARARLWAAQLYMLAGGFNSGWSDVARADSLLAPLVESPMQLSRYERCRLDYVNALRPPRRVRSMYEAARCMVEVSPGSDDAKGELGLNALRVNRPRETLALWTDSRPVKKRPGYWTIPMTAYHMLGAYESELDLLHDALRGFPQNVFIMVSGARALAALDRPDDAKGLADGIRSLPAQKGLASAGLGWIADELRAHDHHDAAQEVLMESIAWLRPRARDTEESHAALAALLYRAGQWDEALPLYQGLAEDHPENTAYLAALGRLAARRGQRDLALRISEDLRSARHTLMEGYRTFERARIAGALGDLEQAMALLQESFEYGASWVRWPLLHSDFDFESLHDYPPFQEFLRPRG